MKKVLLKESEQKKWSLESCDMVPPLIEVWSSRSRILQNPVSTVRHIKLEDFLMMEELYMDARVTLIHE